MEQLGADAQLPISGRLMSLLVPMDCAANDHMQVVEARLGEIVPMPLEVRQDIRYVFLCFTNRCGSNFLANALSSSHLNRAGEFFNGDAIVDNCLQEQLSTVPEYFNLLTHREGKNRFLVSKLSYMHLEILGKAGILERVIDLSRFVMIERADKLAQAISYDLAFQTGRWTYEMESQSNASEAQFSRNRIVEIIDAILDQNRRFAQFFALNGLQPLVVPYEQFANEPTNHIKRLGECLGLPGLSYIPEKIDLQRQSSRINSEWRERFIQGSRQGRWEDKMFESLWIDRECADAKIAEMSACPATEKLAELFRSYKENGYCIIRHAVPNFVIDDYLIELEDAISSGVLKASFGREIMSAELANRRRPLTKVLDSHVYCPSACRAAFSQSIQVFLDALFCEAALAFQSLYFEVGSTQAIHNDTAYVVVDEHPTSMCAAWIALEDIAPGSGQLIYYPGSHRFGDFLYPKNSKHWSPEEDGHAIHNHHLFWINEEAKRRGIKPVSFLPKKGDVLFWHADLCHGGGEISDPTLTRRSLVVHYCPATEKPHYFASNPKKMRKKRSRAVIYLPCFMKWRPPYDYRSEKSARGPIVSTSR